MSEPEEEPVHQLESELTTVEKDTVREQSSSLEDPEDSKESEADASPDGSVNVGTIKAYEANVIGSQSIVVQWMKDAEQHIDNPHEERRMLSAEFFEKLDPESVHGSLGKILFINEEVESVVGQLERNRIVLLVGDTGIGKTQLATACAGVLLRGMSSLKALWRSRLPLDSTVRGDLPHLFSRGGTFERSVVIVSDCFRFRNPEMLRMATSSDRTSRENLRESLKKQGAYLLLTSDEDSCLPPLHRAFRELRVQVFGPDEQMLRSHFLERADAQIHEAGLEEREALELKRRLGERLELHWSKLWKALKGVSGIEVFIQLQLLTYLESPDPDRALELALEKSQRLDSLVDDVRKQGPEAFSALVAMALCQTDARTDAIPWLTFEQIRRRVRAAFERDLRTEEEPRELSSLCSEAETLALLGVKDIRTDAGHFLRFEQGDRAVRTWASLFHVGRRALAVVEPMLDEICRNGGGRLRRQAARALVRIGSLDPEGTILNRLRGFLKQAKVRNDPQIESARWILRAVFSTNDSPLREPCLAHLDSLLKDSRAARVEMGVLALGAIGDLELEIGLDRLRLIVERRLASGLGRLEEKVGVFEDLKAKLPASLWNRAMGDISSQEHNLLVFAYLAELFGEEEEYRVLTACQYVIVGWIFQHGAAPVLEGLSVWMPPGEEGASAAILAMIFLRTNINDALSVLGRVKIQRDGEEGAWNRLLLDCEESEAGSRAVSRFLFKIYLGCLYFPLEPGQVFTSHLWARIRSLVEDCEDSTAHTQALIRLWRQLARMPHLEFQRGLSDLLDDYEFEHLQEPRKVLEEIRAALNPSSE